MKIRLANEYEKQQVKQLWKYCFYDTDPYLTWFFERVYKPENTVVAIDREQVLGALQLLPYTIVIRNKQYPCYYIAGVSTYPQARGGGVGRAVMEYAEQIARKRGIEHLILIPAVDHFYEKFGYVSCYEKIEYTFSPLAIKPEKFNGHIKKANENDINTLLLLYNKYINSFDGYIQRTEDNMRKIWEMYNNFNGGVYIFNDGDAPCGYVVYDINANEMRIDEAVYTTKQGIGGLLWFIYSHHSQTKEIILRTALHDMIGSSLYFNSISAKIIPTVMLKPLGGGNPKLMTGQIDGPMAEVLYGTNEKATLCKNYVNILV